MEHEQHVAERLEQAATLLERTLTWLEEHWTALKGEVDKISATVDPAVSAREEELAAKLAAAESEIADLKAAASANQTTPAVLSSIRKTVPASTADMLAKRGIGDGHFASEPGAVQRVGRPSCEAGPRGVSRASRQAHAQHDSRCGACA